MKEILFNEKELKVVGEAPDLLGGFMIPLYDYPVSLREGNNSTYMDRQGIWMVTGVEQNLLSPSIIPDSCARGFVVEFTLFPREKFGDKDMFGIEWEYIDIAGGSMVKPGDPLLENVNEWKEKIIFPDIDSWDWEGSSASNKEYLNNNKATLLNLLNGCWFERLISFMDFEGAAIAMIDEEQEDALKELFHELTSLFIRIVDKCCEYYQFDCVYIHDDWGSQMAPFFSEEAARNLILPEMKRFCEHVHSKGKYVDLHSCGHIESRIKLFIEAGFDAWTPMAMNDSVALYEKYGDKIVIGIVYDKPFDPATADEEEQRAAARDFAERFAKPGKPSSYSLYNPPGLMTPAFREELYKASRINYSK